MVAPRAALAAASIAAACGTMLLSPIARADPQAEPSAEPPNEGRLREAKELFRQGNALREAGDYERALDFYRRSRALVESVPNTLNAALCLEKLGRFDEALDMYEELLTRLSGELTDADRRAIAPAMEALRRKVGRLDVSANVEGSLIVDGRPRGTLPLQAPVSVKPGAHLVRVVKDGYETFETKVQIKAGETLPIDAKLNPLLRWGKLRVDDPSLIGGELWVDGGLVGKLPWEGTLTPGSHLYVVRKGDVGSAPTRAIVVQGQTVLVGIDAKPLGPETDISAEPTTADVFLDGVLLGKGGWRGRLPIGHHRVEAREVGYVTATSDMDVTAESARHVAVQLRIDPEHPRWARVRTGHLWIESSAGPALAPTMNGGATDACGSGACSSHSAALGTFAALRAGYELQNGISIELGGGMLALHESLTRKLDGSFGHEASTTTTSYEYSDDIFLAALFASAGLGYKRRLGAFVAGGRLHLGAAFPTTRDWITAKASALGHTVPAEVEGSGAAVSSAAFFVLPEADVALRLGRVQIGLGLAGAIFLVNGPSFPIGETRVRGGACIASVSALPVECAPGVRDVAGERAYGPFVVGIPTVTIRYGF